MNSAPKWGTVISVIVVTLLLTNLLSSKFKENELIAKAAASQDSLLHPVESFTVPGTVKSINEAFALNGIEYHPEDQIRTFPNVQLGIGSEITVQRALPVIVVDGKLRTIFRTWQSTVAQLLNENLIELGQDDKISPTLDTLLNPNMTITITRVARTTVIETETIPFQTKIEKDYTQFVGAQTIVSPGQNGELQKNYLLIREDGELKSKTLISQVISHAPQTQIVHQGGLNPVPSQCLVLKDWVVDASMKNGINPNDLFYRIIKESNCHPDSVASAGYEGLLQYDPTFWSQASANAGYSGASIFDAKSQIYVTAWAWAHGYRSRWPIP